LEFGVWSLEFGVWNKVNKLRGDRNAAKFCGLVGLTKI